MPRKYHTLLERDGITSPWCIAFGDYGLETVKYELEDYATGYRAVPRKHLKVITTKDARQATIMAAVATLNAK